MAEGAARHALVTGATGFLGGHVVPLLLALGWSVTALARSEAAAGAATSLGAEVVRGDLGDAGAIDRAFAGCRGAVLVNLASLGFGHADTIVEAAERTGLHRAIFVSTTGIFTSLNAPSKRVRLEAERCIRDSALDWTIVRPTMIYGSPRDRNMWRLLQLLRRTPIVPLPGGGRRLQQPVHVDDLAHGIVAAIGAPSAIGQAYDLAGPEPLSFRVVVQQAARGLGRRAVVVPVPAAPLLGGLRWVEAKGRRAPIKAEQIERLLEDKAFDIEPARRDLGYAPRSFAAGIAAEAQMV